MKKKKHAATVWKGIGCVVFLFIALFPIYWLAAMSIRLTDEMKGHISVIPHSFTLEHFAQLFEREGFGQAILNSAQTTLGSLVISLLRSEERRVGKECMNRMTTDDEKRDIRV